MIIDNPESAKSLLSGEVQKQTGLLGMAIRNANRGDSPMARLASQRGRADQHFV